MKKKKCKETKTPGNPFLFVLLLIIHFIYLFIGGWVSGYDAHKNPLSNYHHFNFKGKNTNFKILLKRLLWLTRFLLQSLFLCFIFVDTHFMEDAENLARAAGALTLARVQGVCNLQCNLDLET